MSLLQSPIRVLDQIDWYLENRHLENFPSAFEKAAGNLSRQLLEQILFILAFYSGMPSTKYMKSNRQLRTAGEILKALQLTNPTTGRRYLAEARRRGPRIRKFAQYPRSLDSWRNAFNEPSHFRNPASSRRTREKQIRRFSQRMRALFDEMDAYLITAAVNEILSKGRIRANLANDSRNTPSVILDMVVSPKNLAVNEDKLVLRSPNFPIRIIPDDTEVPPRWSRAVIIVQHSAGMAIQGQFITRRGTPIDLSSSEAMLKSFANTSSEQKQLERHLRKLGYTLDVQP